MKYQDTVDYSKIDPLKILAQKAALETQANLPASFKEISSSRGESAYVVDLGSFYLAALIEGLGTKSLLADKVRDKNKTYYDWLAQDTIAMAINDLVTVGARPLTLHAYWAAASSDWFTDKKRLNDLVNGWQRACNLAGVVWAGGETPALSGIIEPNTIDLACSVTGIISPKSRLTLGEKLTVGDVIIFIESSGIHANGLSLARSVIENKEDIKKLLTPTIIYSRLIEDLFTNKIDIHYMANITGHGWRKLMRHSKKLTYEIDKVPSIPEVLKIIVKKANLDLSQAYATFNMGAGFALFVDKKQAEKVIEIANKNKLKALIAGRIKQGEKQVIVKPLNLVYKEESLKLRI